MIVISVCWVVSERMLTAIRFVRGRIHSFSLHLLRLQPYAAFGIGSRHLRQTSYRRCFERFSRPAHQRSMAAITISGAHHNSRIHKSGIRCILPRVALPIGTRIYYGDASSSSLSHLLRPKKCPPHRTGKQPGGDTRIEDTLTAKGHQSLRTGVSEL